MNRLTILVLLRLTILTLSLIKILIIVLMIFTIIQLKKLQKEESTSSNETGKKFTQSYCTLGYQAPLPPQPHQPLFFAKPPFLGNPTLYIGFL